MPRRRCVPPVDIVGLTEAAEIVGVSTNALWNRIRRGSFVKPVTRLAATAVWDRRDIVAWMNPPGEGVDEDPGGGGATETSGAGATGEGSSPGGS